jgi:holo-[acyl-carrier protein] synthase
MSTAGTFSQLGGESQLLVGTDLTSIDDVARSVATFGDRYLTRLFTPAEISAAAGCSQVGAAKLAARFAAKEAVIKVLRPEQRCPPWRQIEVISERSGAASLCLHADAACLALHAGITDLAVSLSHEGGFAVAVVVALRQVSPSTGGGAGKGPWGRTDLHGEGCSMDEAIRRVLAQHARLPVDATTVPDDADLYQAGLTSHASVNVMLALEDEFDVEFPQHMLRKRTFESVTAIRCALSELRPSGAQAASGA